MKKKPMLNGGHLGNGIIVWDQSVMKNGDYKTIAHIDSKRQVTWYVKRISPEMREFVEGIVKGPNPSVSTSQPDQKVFEE